MRILTKRALQQRNAKKQKALDAVVTAQPLLTPGISVRRTVPASSLDLPKFVPSIDTDRPSTPAQRSPSTRELVQGRTTLSSFSRGPARQRPPQLPVLKKLTRVAVLKSVKGVKLVEAPSRPRRRRQNAKEPLSINKITHLLGEEFFGDFAKLNAVLKEDITLVSIDTEFERRGLIQEVVEIGLSVLDVKAVLSGKSLPGSHAENWISRLKHTHIVVSDASYLSSRMHRSRFGLSEQLTAPEAKEKVLKALKSLKLSSNGKRRVALVGHSLEGDLRALRHTPSLELDLLDPHQTGIEVVTAFDTYFLARVAQTAGARLTAFSLSAVAQAVGISPRHVHEGRLKGWHSASNDAAYTMMTLLLFLAKGWHLKYALARGHGVRDSKSIRLDIPDTMSRLLTKLRSYVESWTGK